LRASAKARAVAGQHFHVGQQVMAKGHRLRGLQVSKARHDVIGVFQRLLASTFCSPAICSSNMSRQSRT
jgi:hypothetical protein